MQICATQETMASRQGVCLFQHHPKRMGCGYADFKTFDRRGWSKGVQNELLLGVEKQQQD